MNRVIIGTAGHIDHGKTTIIKELTGFEGDATPEEKRRGITIELSFSSMDDGDNEISFIDVPGHEKLVKTMIGGAFGFDYVLIVIDVNEGAKEQTREHLLILDSIKSLGVIAVLSKSDLADEETMERRKSETIEFLGEYKNLSLLSILPFSVKKKEQKEELKNYLFSLKSKPAQTNRLARLYIDRVFSVAGAGCVVTGTLLDGEISAKEPLYIPQIQKSVKARSIQTHNKTVDKATQGQRTAINLSDVSHNEIKKGMLLTKKGFMRGFKDIDVVIHKKPETNVKHLSELTAFFGADAAACRVFVISEDEGRITATLKFDKNMFLVYGEPFVLRNSSHTVGGGVAIGVVADPLKKSQREALLAALEKKELKKAFAALMSAHKTGFGLICSEQRFGIGYAEALEIASGMDGVIVDEKDKVLYPQNSLDALALELKKIYAKNPAALLAPKSVKQKLSWASEYLAQIAFAQLEAEGVITSNNGLYSLTENKNRDLCKELTDIVLAALESSDFMPEAPYNIYDKLDIDRAFGDEILKKLCSSQKAVRLAHNHFISAKSLQAVLQEIRTLIQKDGFATVASVKEALGISRKYAINYLEYLDRWDDIENIEQKRVFNQSYALL